MTPTHIIYCIEFKNILFARSISGDVGHLNLKVISFYNFFYISKNLVPLWAISLLYLYPYSFFNSLQYGSLLLSKNRLSLQNKVNIKNDKINQLKHGFYCFTQLFKKVGVFKLYVYSIY